MLFAVGVGLWAASTAYSAYDRYFNQDQSGWQALLGGAADATGISGIYAGITGRDLVMQHHLSLTPAQQRQMLTEGSIQAGGSGLLLYGGVRSFLRGRAPAAGEYLSEVDKELLGRLRQGIDVEVPPGTTGIRTSMSDLTLVSNNEVALLRLTGGRRVLRMGGPTSVKLGPEVQRVIAHTHPSGRLQFSKNDIAALRKLGQRSSVIIDPRADIGVRLPVPSAPPVGTL